MKFCWQGNVEWARLRFGEGSAQAVAALNHPSTCMLPTRHSGAHQFTFDGDIAIRFASEKKGPDAGRTPAQSDS